MKKDDSVYVGHMLDTSRKAVEKVRRMNRAGFDANEDVRLALTHLLQVIGEAAARMSQDYRERHPEIPWAHIIGMRNRVVHDYLDVDEDVVWDTAVNDLPPLIVLLEQIAPK